MIKIIFILFIFSTKLFSQELDSEDYAFPNSIQVKYKKMCFDKLKPIEDLKRFTSLNNKSICNLKECFLLFQHDKIELEKIGFERLKEFSKLFYNEKLYIVLVFGEESFSKAEEKNLDIKDDNEKIYVSVGGCRVTKATINAVEIFNSELSKLFKK